MPFQSEKQRRFLHANHPEIAKRWERDYAHGGILDINESEEIISNDGNEIELTDYNAAFDDPNDLSTGVKSLFRAKEGGTPQLARKSKSGKRPGYGGPHETYGGGVEAGRSSGPSDRGPRDDPGRFGTLEIIKIAEGAIIRELVPDSVTTHRFLYWKQIILKSKKPIIGYGPLGDRFLIHENSSNTLIYSYASGGVISTILMLILIIRYTYLCLFLTFIKKISLQKKNIFVFSSIFTISFLFFRGIAEVGIAVFSIDFLVFLSCITICEKSKIQK